MNRSSDTQTTMPAQPVGVPAGYLPLYTYLDNKHANIMVLTFAEIEGLLGFSLPALARRLPEWWADANTDNTPSTQSRSWNQANMTAKPNLSTETVVFERTCA
jgi:hypothetical protein